MFNIMGAESTCQALYIFMQKTRLEHYDQKKSHFCIHVTNMKYNVNEKRN